MDGIANIVGLNKNSSLYQHALTIYHKFKLHGGGCKFSENALQAACLKLACDIEQVNSQGLLKKCSVHSKALEGCIELIAGIVGMELNLISIELVCTRLGISPDIMRLASQLLETLQQALLSANEATRNQFKTGPVLIASLYYLLLQVTGLRISTQTIADATYANTQQFQRCSLIIKSILGKEIDQISQNETLLKEIKQYGRHAKKLLKKASLLSLTTTDKKSTPVNNKPTSEVTEEKFDYFDTHYVHDLGYSAFVSNPPRLSLYYNKNRLF